jgi:tRNA-intron endonuclease
MTTGVAGRSAEIGELEPLTAYMKGDKVFIKICPEVKGLREKGYGYPSRGKLYLNPYETLYLVEKGKLYVKDLILSNQLSFRDLIGKLGKNKVETWIKYLVYRDLRERGYIVRESSIVDFEIYGKTVMRRLLSIIHEGTDASLSRLNKLVLYAKKERKELILAVIDRRTDIVYYILDLIQFDRRITPWLNKSETS